jgi:O-methyltransferase involved in polyketide biosynthesis
MPRAHDDDWDLASSVGATATMVTVGRAMATKAPRGLINDPFAEPLVRAVGVELFTKMMDGDLDAIENSCQEAHSPPNSYLE